MTVQYHESVSQIAFLYIIKPLYIILLRTFVGICTSGSEGDKKDRALIMLLATFGHVGVQCIGVEGLSYLQAAGELSYKYHHHY